MPNKIKPKRSYTANAVPTTSDLETNELCINWTDGKAFTKTAAGQIVSVTLGGGGGSGEDAVLRALFVPPAPTSVTATAGNAQATVSWTAPTGVISQAPITDYSVQYSSNSGSSWTTFSDGTSTATSATVAGLTNGTAYVFRVAAINAVGTGSYSTASSAITPEGSVFRAIPTLTSNTSSGTAEANTVAGGAVWNLFDGTASEYYTARNGSDTPKRHFQYSFAGGVKSFIGGYTFTGLGDRNANVISWELSGSNDGTSFTLIESRSTTWASAGQVLAFTLSAPVNYSTYRWTLTPDGTNDSFAGLREVQLLATVPSAPTSLTATSGNAQIALAWTAPSYTGGSAITGYSVEYTPSGGSAQTVSTGSTSASYTLTGLTNGTAYTVRVAAINANGTGTYTAASSSVTPVSASAPGAPTLVRNGNAYWACQDGENAVMWNAPSSDGGSQITGYVWRIGSGSLTSVSPSTGTSGAFSNPSWTGGRVEGLPTSGSFQVAAVNAIGTGTFASVTLQQDCN